MSSRQDYEPYICRREWNNYDLEEAGFFEDGHNRETLSLVLNDKRWVTPTAHLGSHGIVLCTTGAFDPFHTGHLRMLAIAKRELEAQGKTVAGALIQPDHDEYVRTKHDGARPAIERIAIAQESIKDVPWVAVDPWACLYQDRKLNYTTILRRTERYLGPGYQVVYVFGSDNAGFKDAFSPHEYFMVGRPGHANPHKDAIQFSSTMARMQSTDRRWESPHSRPSDSNPYILREDVLWATQGWPVSSEAKNIFSCDVIFALNDALGMFPRPVYRISQQDYVDSLKEPHINFDFLTGGQHWVSRVFSACSHQYSPIKWLSSDLSKIPAGEYALVDDDIASGATAAFIEQSTPQVRWTKRIGLTDPFVPRPWFDIVDARDFLFGSKRGGLLVTDGKSTYRAPYILPWVNLLQRAKIAPREQVQFTRSIIEANIRFFTACDPVITVGDTDNMAFWQRLGFTQDQSMRYVSEQLLSWIPAS